MMGAAGASGDKVYVDDVFSTFLYEGNGTSQTINNGIDVSGEGGLVWIKNREITASDHIFTDTERGTNTILESNRAREAQTKTDMITSFNSNGFSVADIKSLQELINAENSDLFDVLEYIAYAKEPISREDRAIKAEDHVYEGLNDKQREFIEFVLGKYIEGGVEELDIKRLPDHINLKYKSLHDGEKELGNPEIINKTFVDFQKYLYL